MKPDRNFLILAADDGRIIRKAFFKKFLIWLQYFPEDVGLCKKETFNNEVSHLIGFVDLFLKSGESHGCDVAPILTLNYLERGEKGLIN